MAKKSGHKWNQTADEVDDDLDLTAPLEHKHLRVDLQLKAVDQPGGEFTGYANVTGIKDLGGDIIEPGAFMNTLKELGGKVPLVAGHWADNRLGVVYLEEDAKGLRVKRGVVNTGTTMGKDAAADLAFFHEHGLPLEMSIGFRIPEGKAEVVDGVRYIKEVELWEVSLVTFGMNQQSKVDNVKERKELQRLWGRLGALEAEIKRLNCEGSDSEESGHTTADAAEDIAEQKLDQSAVAETSDEVLIQKVLGEIRKHRNNK